MAAFFQANSQSDIFNSSVSYSSPCSTAFDGVGNSLGLITSVSFGTQESTQFFLTFDDIINYIYFGRGLGQINVTGIALPTCNYSLPALSAFFNVVKSNRGKIMTVSISGVGAVSGPLITSNCSITGEPTTMGEFSASMAMTNHTFGSKVPSGGSC